MSADGNDQVVWVTGDTEAYGTQFLCREGKHSVQTCRWEQVGSLSDGFYFLSKVGPSAEITKLKRMLTCVYLLKRERFNQVWYFAWRIGWRREAYTR